MPSRQNAQVLSDQANGTMTVSPIDSVVTSAPICFDDADGLMTHAAALGRVARGRGTGAGRSRRRTRTSRG